MGGSGLEGLSELGVGLPVGGEVRHPGHLHHEQHAGPVPLPQAAAELFQVLDTPLGGGVGEQGGAVLL